MCGPVTTNAAVWYNMLMWYLLFYHADAHGEKVNHLCILEYLVKGNAGELQFKVRSHGNVKDQKKPFLPTKKSIIEEIKSQQRERKRNETPNEHEMLAGFCELIPQAVYHEAGSK